MAGTTSDLARVRERFSRIAGRAPHATMSYEAFIADLVQRDVPLPAARAAHTTVAGAGGAVSFDAYAFVVGALERPHGAPASAVELNALAHRLRGHHSVGDVIRELAPSSAHVAWCAHAIGGAEASDSPARAPATELLGEQSAPLARMRALGLEPGDLLRAHARERRRVVLDGRSARATLGPRRNGHDAGHGGGSWGEGCAAASSASAHAAAPTLGRPSAHKVVHDSVCMPLLPAEPQLPSPRVGERAPQPPPATHIASERVVAEHMSSGLVVDPEMLTASRWRGPLAPARGSLPFELSRSLVGRAQAMAADVVAGRPLAPSGAGSGATAGAGAAAAAGSGGISPVLARLLGTADPAAAVSALEELLRACAAILAAQPALVRARAPCKVVGDVHGQLADLLALLHLFGFPSSHGPGGDVEVVSYVFNGDFVDRGEHQLETAALLCAAKVAFPTRVLLVRGNHEMREMNREQGDGALGFERACALALGDGALGARAFDACHAAFDWLPIGCLVASTALVVHGGLGDGSWGVRQLEAEAEACRPLRDLSRAPDSVVQALWSDPVDESAPAGQPAHARDPTGRIKLTRAADTAAFCAREGLSLVVRSHQCVSGGFRVAHGGRMVTVFSARDYHNGAHTNDGALLLLAEDDEGHMRLRTKVLASRARGDDSDEGHALVSPLVDNAVS